VPRRRSGSEIGEKAAGVTRVAPVSTSSTRWGFVWAVRRGVGKRLKGVWGSQPDSGRNSVEILMRGFPSLQGGAISKEAQKRSVLGHPSRGLGANKGFHTLALGLWVGLPPAAFSHFFPFHWAAGYTASKGLLGRGPILGAPGPGEKRQDWFGGNPPKFFSFQILVEGGASLGP